LQNHDEIGRKALLDRQKKRMLVSAARTDPQSKFSGKSHIQAKKVRRLVSELGVPVDVGTYLAFGNGYPKNAPSATTILTDRHCACTYKSCKDYSHFTSIDSPTQSANPPLYITLLNI